MIKTTRRAEYRQAQLQRAARSATLAEKFAGLTALTINVSYLAPDGSPRNRNVKHTVNVERAPSEFHLTCLNHECIEGDYDLTELLNRAVTNRDKQVTATMCCQGWQDRLSIDRRRCGQQIALTMNLDYSGLK
ncbi:hypothetical protein GC207_05585 [bacterium]|nr:hypothetical protein [bacterium]